MTAFMTPPAEAAVFFSRHTSRSKAVRLPFTVKSRICRHGLFAHKFCLQFDYSPDTDNSLAKVNDFSVNALLEAIRLGTFKGDKGEKGDTGDKGEKGEKGDTGEVSLDYANSNFADAIKKTKSGNPVIIDNASPLVHTLEVKTHLCQKRGTFH